MSWKHSIIVDHYSIWRESTREVFRSQPDHIELVDLFSMFRTLNYCRSKHLGTIYNFHDCDEDDAIVKGGFLKCIAIRLEQVPIRCGLGRIIWMTLMLKSNRTGMMHVFVIRNLAFHRSVFHARCLGLFRGQYIVFKLTKFDLWNGQWQSGSRSFRVSSRRGDGHTSRTTEANHPGPAICGAQDTSAFTSIGLSQADTVTLLGAP